jgi:hypothetical protein
METNGGRERQRRSASDLADGELETERGEERGGGDV